MRSVAAPLFVVQEAMSNADCLTGYLAGLRDKLGTRAEGLAEMYNVFSTPHISCTAKAATEQQQESSGSHSTTVLYPDSDYTQLENNVYSIHSFPQLG